MTTLRDDIADLRVRLDEAEQSAQRLPHREKYLLLVTDFMRRYLELHLELIDTIEREMEPGRASLQPTSQQQNERDAETPPIPAV